jgi:hypothetical protein
MRGMIRTLALSAVLAAGTATVAMAQGVNNTGYDRNWYNGYSQYGAHYANPAHRDWGSGGSQNPAPQTEANSVTPPNHVSPPRYVLQGGYVDGGKWRGQWVLEPSGAASN